MWKEIRDFLLNLDEFYWDLYITTVYSDFDIDGDIINLANHVSIHIVKNKGYDVGPFMFIINSIDIIKYDYIIKLHTKRNMKYSKTSMVGNYFLCGSRWRNKLLSFIKSKENIKKCISTMERNKNVGMCGNHSLIIDNYSDRDFPSMDGARLLLKNNFSYSGSIKFIAGTMFIVRAKIFTPIIKMNINIDNFTESSANRQSSLAHIMERVFGGIVIQQGFTIEDCFTKNRNYIVYFERTVGLLASALFEIQRFIFQRKKTKNKNIILKIMKIPVYIKKIK